MEELFLVIYDTCLALSVLNSYGSSDNFSIADSEAIAEVWRTAR